MHIDGPGYVLIVEDDDAISETLSAFLATEGIRTEVAKTREEARSTAQRHRPEVTLMDYLLADGPCDPLLASDGTFAGAPVILMTAAAGAAAHADRLAVHALLKKPFDIEHLTELVREAF